MATGEVVKVDHSDLVTQEKYLPVMKEAVKQGKALASSLACLKIGWR